MAREFTRLCLTSGQEITLSWLPDGGQPETFFIRAVIGEGGSCVCYDAIRTRDNLSGKLKEFYPCDEDSEVSKRWYSMTRLPNGQLTPGGGTIRNFPEIRSEYLEKYQLLKNVIAENPDNEVLKNFIQLGDTLYGIPYPDDSRKNAREATAYIWSPGIAGVCFDEYLARVRKEPEKTPDQRLCDILEAAATLTDCISAMHIAGLLHLDIKPSNFMIPYDSAGSIRPGSISMFDVNTVYELGRDGQYCAGTEGFCAPEILENKPRCWSDVYSIGAVLFNALVVTDEAPDGLYHDGLYLKLDHLLQCSRLIDACQGKRDAVLMTGLADILKRCLAKDPEDRWSSKTLLEALGRVWKRAQQYDTRHLDPNQHFTIIETAADPVIVIWKLLREHPLYMALKPGASRLRVLTAGSGAFGQTFIDLCMQAAQMNGFTLEITAVSDFPEIDRDSYLRFRPSLPRFAHIEGISEMPENEYAALRFLELPEKRKFDNVDAENNRKIVRSLLDGEAYDYIFVALGGDSLNRSAAEAFTEEADGCPVCYVREAQQTEPEPTSDALLFPVSVKAKLSSENICADLDDMAFNADLCWNSDLNLDIQESRRKFLQSDYRYTSSLAYVLSIPYKLFSLGIADRRDLLDPDAFAAAGYQLTDSLAESARKFDETVLQCRLEDEKAAAQFRELVALEHRRWLFYMAASGWTLPKDEKGKFSLLTCVDEGAVKNEEKRTQPCMLCSTAETPLHGKGYRAPDRHAWETGEIDPALDPLDRMSVELHRLFRARAKAFLARTPFPGEDLDEIFRLVSDCGDEVQTACKRYRFCLQNVRNGAEGYTRQYSHYESGIMEALRTAPEHLRQKVEDRLSRIRKAYFPVIEANLYRDYKANDETLVEKIPFIVTYRFQARIAMALEDGAQQSGRGDAIFSNVAAATVLSPTELIYLYRCTEDSDLRQLERTLTAVLRYLGQRKVRCSVRIAAVCTNHVKLITLQEILERLEAQSRTQNAVLRDYRLALKTDDGEAAARFLQYLKEQDAALYDGSTALFASPLQNGAFLRSVTEAHIPYFEFDRKRKQFRNCIGCEHLRYVQDGAYIRIQDMFSLLDAADSRFHFPEFAEDYERLWRIYSGKDRPDVNFTESVDSWNRLCSVLAAYEAKQPPLAVLPLAEAGAAAPECREYTLPGYVFQPVEELLNELIALGAVREGSTLQYTADRRSCRLKLLAQLDFLKEFDRMFQPAHYDDLSYGIQLLRQRSFGQTRLIIRCDRMEVQDVLLDEDCLGKADRLADILQELADAGFIQPLGADDSGRVSFRYAEPGFRHLLTTPGELLKIRTYYEALRTGYFDDAACGYAFRWGGSEAENELDVVLTKGFRSILVECRTAQRLESGYYQKLYSMAEHFGVGAVKVLVGNTFRSDEDAQNANRAQRSQGELTHIFTVSGEAEIENIGETLKNLIETAP